MRASSGAVPVGWPRPEVSRWGGRGALQAAELGSGEEERRAQRLSAGGGAGGVADGCSGSSGARVGSRPLVGFRREGVRVAACPLRTELRRRVRSGGL